jgi:hypothetical protein
MTEVWAQAALWLGLALLAILIWEQAPQAVSESPSEPFD